MNIIKLILDVLTSTSLLLMIWFQNVYVYIIALIVSLTKLLIMIIEKRKRDGKR